MITLWARIKGILLFFILTGAAVHAQAFASSLTILYSSNSFGVLAPCPS